ncbi:MAG: SAM-dependent methyltransferase [Candidatus Cloacimonetes bacterium]|nr:SAM-dependent methyltransferase [Candidatus Cloacimonadota bacterium]
MNNNLEQLYIVYPVGKVVRAAGKVTIIIREQFRPALRQLDKFTHVLVLWWADQHDNASSRSQLQCNPPYAASHLTGIFACRAEYRPNPIAVTTCRLEAVDEEKGVLQITDIDAYDGTPVLDLKAYFPVCDRVRKAEIPNWLHDWPEWIPEEGLGLE